MRLLAAVRPGLAWEAVLVTLFAVRGAFELLLATDNPSLIGSHGIFYASAARAWLTGGDPWTTGPIGAVFGGPPTMLLPFAPFAFLPPEVTRLAWFLGMIGIGIWALRRLRLSWYWLAFPPLLGAMILGHPEVLVLALLTLRGPLSGLAATIKPYAAAALLAERRRAAFIVAAALVLATSLLLPWGRFIAELPAISGVLASQSHGDSTFGDPILMVAGSAALLALGPRRALWLAVPVLWPSAQPVYKVGAMPGLSRLLALFWAVPVPGATLAGVIVEAVVVTANRRWRLPEWLRLGIMPIGFPALDAPISAAAADRRAAITATA